MKLRHIIVFFLLAFASLESIAATDSISVTVDTLCDQFRVCVSDYGVKGGIASVRLINGSYNNTNFGSEGSTMIEYTDSLSNVCFNIFIVRLNTPVYVYVDITTNSGYVRTLYIKKDPTIRLSPFIGKLQYTPFNAYIDTTVTIYNESSKPMVLYKIGLSSKDSIYRVDSFSHQLPVVLQKNDSFSFQLSMHKNIIGNIFDSIVVETDCRTQFYLLLSLSETAIIQANDVNIGDVFIGERICANVIVVNDDGRYPIQVSRMDTSNRSTPYLFYNHSDKLPIVITEASQVPFIFCYQPLIASNNDSLLIIWKTDIDTVAIKQMKDYSIIRASSTIPIIKWESADLRFSADSTQVKVLSNNFINHAPAGTFIKRFYISGKDSAEFNILNSLSPLSNVTMLRNETDWFDIAFKPDMTKPLSERYADRHATLIAELNDSIVTVELIGTFNPLGVKHELAIENISFSPNPVYGQDATLSFTLSEPKKLAISIFDILGREVITLPSQYYSSGSYSNAIGTSKLGDGSYILKVSDGSFAKSISFRVVR